jgi:hypothetical protein
MAMREIIDGPVVEDTLDFSSVEISAVAELKF